MSDNNFNIKNTLNKIRKKQLFSWSFSSWIIAFSGLFTGLFLLTVLESIFWFSTVTRGEIYFYLRIFIAFILLLPLSLTLLSLFLKKWPGDEYLSRLIWKRDIHTRDQVLNALQLLEQKNNLNSEDLRLEAIRRADKLCQKLEIDNYIDRRIAKKSFRYATFLFISIILLIIPFYRIFYSSANRLTHPEIKFIKPGTVLLHMAMPDTINVIQGESLELTALAEINRPEFIEFYLDEGLGLINYITAVNDTLDSMKFSGLIKEINRDLKVYAQYGKVISDTVQVITRYRPRIARLEVSVNPPPYTGLKSQYQSEGIGDVTALPGSRVKIKLEANLPLSEGEIIYRKFSSKTDTISLTVKDRTAEGSFRVSKEAEYWVNLTSLDGIISNNPIKWDVFLQQDYPPSIEVRSPDEGAEIPQHLIVPLVVIVDDDYGISNVNLRYRLYNEFTTPDSVPEEIFSTIPLDGTDLGQGRFLIKTPWSLQGLPLIPSDEIRYFIEAWDNDGWHGPKRSRTEIRRLIYPSLDDLYNRVAEEEGSVEEELSQALDKAESIKENIEETLQQLRSNPQEMSWEENLALQQSLENQKDLMQQLEQAKQTLEQVQEQFEEHNMVNMEMLEKYSKLQQLIEEIASPELLKAMEELQQALEKQDGQQIREALEDLMQNQEAFIESLDRSLSILEQLKNERKMEELVNRAEELAKREKDLQQKIQNSENQSNPQLTFEQEQLNNDLSALMQDMKETNESLSETSPAISDSLNQLQEDMNNPSLEEEMDKTANQLRNSQMKQASNSAQKNQKRLQEMSERLKSLKESLNQENKDKLAEEMDKLFAELFLFSRQLESLMNESATLSPSSPRYRELASRQDGMLESLKIIEKHVSDISKETFFVGSQIAGELALAEKMLNSALSRYTARRAQDASDEQGGALASVNRSMIKLGKAKDQMQQSSSSTGYDEMMEQLSKMSEQQQSINQNSQGMPMPQPGQMPGQGQQMPGQGQMSRLAAQQRALAEAMKQLEKDSQSMEDVLGSLDGLGNAMEDVAKDLDNRQVTDRTKRLQQRILQRLLDSQRSMQQRELSRKRQSTTGQDILRASPGQLTQTEEDLLRKRLEKALEGDYTQPWKKVIQDYFRALEKDKEKVKN